MTHDRVLAIDDLHTLALGAYAFFCSFLILLCFKADVWETGEATEEARIARSVDRMKPELAEYYRGLRSQGHRPTEIQELSPSMFGTASSPSWVPKAAETNYFLGYARTLILNYGRKLPNAPTLLAAVDCLLRCRELVQTHRYRFPTDALQDRCPGKGLDFVSNELHSVLFLVGVHSLVW